VIEMLNMDCMEYMRGLPDKAFELAIVDPEFGIGIGNSPRLVTDKGLQAKAWDNTPIDPFYFTELFRVSKNQIIWGGNYYAMPPNKHCVIWDKLQPEALSFGMFDYAWTSFNGSNKIFRLSTRAENGTLHPTAKPVALYKWLLSRYAKPGDRILDTHGGSGSICIACHDLGYDLTWMELDEDYYKAACERYKIHASQAQLFQPEPIKYKQAEL